MRRVLFLVLLAPLLAAAGSEHTGMVDGIARPVALLAAHDGDAGQHEMTLGGENEVAPRRVSSTGSPHAAPETEDDAAWAS